MPNHEKVYREQAVTYDRLIAREDYLGHIPESIRRIVDIRGLDVCDLGAGTGRLACMFASEARRLVLLDQSESMLAEAADKLHARGMQHYKTIVADHRELPLEDNAVDAVLSGWSICYIGSTQNSDWETDMERTMTEIERIVRPGGIVIVLETLGTGVKEATPPGILLPYYRQLEDRHGFEHLAIRTDYRFESREEGEELASFFFGEEMAGRLEHTADGWVLPECTGLWWKRQA